MHRMPKPPLRSGFSTCDGGVRRIEHLQHERIYEITMPEQVPMSHQDRAYTSPIWYTPGK